MRNQALARDYLERAQHRLAAIEVLMKRKAYADVVRESQEVSELCLKALLRLANIEVPKIHDVGDILLAHRQEFPKEIQGDLDSLAEISHELRRDRELAFYGTEDLTPGEFYKEKDAKRSLRQAKTAHQKIARLLEK